MKTKIRRTMRSATVGVALLSLASVTPAYAEGDFETFIDGWTLHQESRRWSDRNADAASTSVSFSGCSTDGSSGFNSAQLKLWKDVFGPDEDHGTRTNTCNRVYWGDKSAGSYYFSLWGLSSGGVLNVKTVKVYY
ncbi:hypothetical protein [Streptomyces sp. NPDC020141]|uniref:hypothetical protein n=1 Tax=Streptomyces sp. NPDC020141 TaxID=3365065 RepID=UPI0037B6091E